MKKVHKKDFNSCNDNNNYNDNHFNNENIVKFFRKYGIDSIVEEKLNNNGQSNNELNKENSCKNIKL